MIRNGIEKLTAEKQIQRANDAFPDALVINYESLITKLNLPDIKDRHVLAVAIKAEADIVTNNLKDFPLKSIHLYGLEVISPDDFLTEMICFAPERAMQAFKEMVSYKSKAGYE